MATLATSSLTETSFDNVYLYLDNTYDDWAQTFTVPSGFTWDITSVTLRLRKGTDFVDGLTVSICDTSGGDPDTSSVQGTTAYDTSGVGTGSFGNYVVSVSASSLVAGTYAIVVQATNASDGNDFAPFMLIAQCAASAYTGGGSYQDQGSLPRDNSWTGPVASYDLCFVITGTATATHSKASNPTPANSATEVDFSGFGLSWDGTGDTYNVYIGETGDLTLVSSAQAGTSYTTTLNELETIFDSSPIEQKIYWRVDSTQGAETLTGDEWNFDARPGQATNPTPANAGTDIGMEQDFSWDAVNYTDTYDLVISSNTVSAAQAGVTFSLDDDYWDWGEEVTWRVDSTNIFGTTAGTEWTFTALDLDSLQVTYTLISGGSGNGPYDGGVEGTDFWFTGLNNVVTVNRLVCIAKDSFYFESLN